GAAALALAPIANAIPAGAAVAAKAPVIGFVGGAANFRVGGHFWCLSFFVLDGGFVGIDISTGHESYSWDFLAVPKSDLKVNFRTGAAIFNTHTALAPVASAKLRFSPSSRHKRSCRSGSDTFFKGKVTGSISLVASKRLKFRSAHVTFRGAVLD